MTAPAAGGVRADDLAVVIPTRDRWPILRRTLDALARQSAPGFETVVVVDGLDQSPPDLPGVRTLVVPHGGPGAARNAGVRATDRRLVLFLGDDMVPADDLVARHLARHAEHPGATTAVLGRVVPHPEVRRNRIVRWLDWSGTQFDFRGIAGDEATFAHFYTGNVSVGRELLLDAGGFDEGFPFVYEDVELGWRLSQRGMRLLYARDAVAFHLHDYDLRRLEGRFEVVGAGERRMTEIHPWFAPFFAARVRYVSGRRPVSRLWPLVVDVVPSRPRRLRRIAERRANRWYYRHLAPAFLRGWGGPLPDDDGDPGVAARQPRAGERATDM